MFPAMVQQLLPKLGFAWTMRVVGFLQLGLMGIANLGLRPRLPPRRAGPWVEWGAFKEGQYSLYAAGMFFVRIPLRLTLCPGDWEISTNY